MKLKHTSETTQIEELKEILPPLREDDYSRLKKSIEEQGIQESLKILPNGIIIDGYHRKKIAQELGIKNIPYEIKQLNKDEALELGISLNLARRNLSFEQKIEIIKKLRERGWAQEKIAKLIGIARSTIIRLENRLENGSIVQMDNASIPDDLRYKISKEMKKEIAERADKGETQEEIAKDYGISRRRVGQIIKKKKEEIIRREKRVTMPFPEGEFEIIVIDPPWPYGTEYDSEDRRVASPYSEMDLEEIRDLEIPAADDCILWLWATHKFLPEAFGILEDWGFEYKLTLVWNKRKMGMGSWLRCQVEFCLLGIKGNPEWNLTNQRDIILESRREHSRKPDKFYKMVKKIHRCSSNRRLNYFARIKRKGFISWGDETTRFK